MFYFLPTLRYSPLSFNTTVCPIATNTCLPEGADAVRVVLPCDSAALVARLQHATTSTAEESKRERPGLQLATAVTAPLPVSVWEAHLLFSQVRRGAIEVGQRREDLTAAKKKLLQLSSSAS